MIEAKSYSIIILTILYIVQLSWQSSIKYGNCWNAGRSYGYSYPSDYYRRNQLISNYYPNQFPQCNSYLYYVIICKLYNRYCNPYQTQYPTNQYYYYGYSSPYNFGQSYNGYQQIYPKTTITQDRKEQNQPIYFGQGNVQLINNNKDVELMCSFDDPNYKIISNAVWVKVIGNYNFDQYKPVYECIDQCTYTYINALNDFRYRVITIPPKSTLRIYDVLQNDYGIYRCTVTAQKSDGFVYTLYQVIELR